MPPLQTFEGLQALRFLAAFLVVVHHSGAHFADMRDGPDLNVGGYGVSLFFVISGFVMVTSTSNRDPIKSNWRIFVLRRLVRIVPIYWLATLLKLTVATVWPGAVQHAEPSLEALSKSLLFIPTRNVDGNFYPFHNVGWTLNFEMAFYLLVAVALFFGVKPLLLGFVLIPLVAFLGIGYGGQLSDPAYSFYLNPIVLYFLAGMVIGTFVVERGWGILTLGMVLVLAFWFVLYWAETGSVSGAIKLLLEPLVVLAVVLFTVSLERGLRGRVPQFLLTLGEASYSIYLFHPFIVPVFARIPLAPETYLGVLAVSVVFAVFATSASLPAFRYLERPATSFLKNLLFSRDLPRTRRQGEGSAVSW